MHIDRKHVEEQFKSYTDAYDSTDEKVALKIEHTGKVAQICEEIAKSLSLKEEEVDFAWLLGMLHDIGRFEQLRRFHTFYDAKSVDHAILGAELLEEGLLQRFWKDASDKERDTLLKAIRFHNRYVLPPDLTDEEKLFCDLIRDADKVDIFRVAMSSSTEAIYSASREELLHSQIAEEVFANFQEKRAILRSLRKYPMDILVGHISLAFELVFKRSRELALEMGYLAKMLAVEPASEKTREQMRQIKEMMLDYLAQ